jgi:hypothetical protein
LAESGAQGAKLSSTCHLVEVPFAVSIPRVNGEIVLRRSREIPDRIENSFACQSIEALIARERG